MLKLKSILLGFVLFQTSCAIWNDVTENDVLDVLEIFENNYVDEIPIPITHYDPATDTKCSQCIRREKEDQLLLNLFGHPLGPVLSGDYPGDKQPFNYNDDVIANEGLDYNDDVSSFLTKNQDHSSSNVEQQNIDDEIDNSNEHIMTKNQDGDISNGKHSINNDPTRHTDEMQTILNSVQPINDVDFLNQNTFDHTEGNDVVKDARLKTDLDELIRLNEQYINELRIKEKNSRKKRDLFDIFILNQESNGLSRFLNIYQNSLDKWRRKSALAKWREETNLTLHNRNISIKTDLEFSNWILKWQRYATKQFTYNNLNCPQKRMLKSITKTAEPKSENLRKKESELSSKIKSIYSKAKVCDKTSGKCYSYEPGLKNIMSHSKNYSTLLWAWKNWRDVIGPKIREDWIEIKNIANIGARERGYLDIGQYWRSRYEVPHLNATVIKLWEDIKPLYQQLHAYVRYKLHQEYGDKVNLTGPIPAHILGDMWAMSWANIFDIVKPYKVDDFGVTKAMKSSNYTVHKMFKLADQFYQSIGLPPMPKSFWELSMFTRPKNKSVVCYASAHNLEGTDVRIKMCAGVNDEYFYVVHHEMGHCQYYLAYNLNQPALFQGGANSGFHEAIGDTAALSVISPSHLSKLGLIKENNTQSSYTKHEQKINFLMKRALQKLAFYPFALTMDEWRWKVFNGEIKTDNLNQGWWDIRFKNQGIVPPSNRSENDFDPGSKFHITYSVPYIRYFISHILQFQFYEKLCQLSGYQGELYNCDFAGSKTAGKKFGNMLKLGSSKHWKDILKTLTGSCNMQVSSMKKYFKPLTNWLQLENKRLGLKIGWE